MYVEPRHIQPPKRPRSRRLRLLYIGLGVALLVYGLVLALNVPRPDSQLGEVVSSTVPATVPPAATSSHPVITTQATPFTPTQPITLAPAQAPTDSQFGVSLGTTLLGLSNTNLNAELSDLSSLGVGWIRMDFDWGVIQPKNSSTYNWSAYDRVVRAAGIYRIKILGLLGYTPGWARPDGCDSTKCPPASDEQFAAFSSAVVERYAPQGVHDWEIWNEPNNAGFWQPKADSQAYAQLLKATYPVIKGVDPSATVITAGLAPEPSDGSNITPTDFLTQLYADGAGGYFDAVGMHPYSFPAFPNYVANWNAWQQMSATKPSLRSIMIANGDGNKQVWMTEYGAPTGGPGVLESNISDTSFIDSPDHVTENLQAHMISQAVDLKSSYSWAGPLFIYSYKDLGTNQNDRENFFGLLRYDGSQKPAYAALKAALQ